MAQEQINPYGGLIPEQIVLHFSGLLKNRTINEVIGRLTVSDMVDGYNIFLANKDQMRCFKA
jgi:hypothetical protein